MYMISFKIFSQIDSNIVEDEKKYIYIDDFVNIHRLIKFHIILLTFEITYYLKMNGKMRIKSRYFLLACYVSNSRILLRLSFSLSLTSFYCQVIHSLI
jgi:hypothetical protein